MISQEQTKVESVITKKSFNDKNPDWCTLIKHKEIRTQEVYKTFIRRFIKKYGELKYYTQQNIDAYFGDLESKDMKNENKNRENKATKQVCKAALRFYLNIKFKYYSIKAETKKRAPSLQQRQDEGTVADNPKRFRSRRRLNLSSCWSNIRCCKHLF